MRMVEVEKYSGVRRDWSVPNVCRGRVLNERRPDWERSVDEGRGEGGGGV